MCFPAVLQHRLHAVHGEGIEEKDHKNAAREEAKSQATPDVEFLKHEGQPHLVGPGSSPVGGAVVELPALQSCSLGKRTAMQAASSGSLKAVEVELPRSSCTHSKR